MILFSLAEIELAKSSNREPNMGFPQLNPLEHNELPDCLTFSHSSSSPPPPLSSPLLVGSNK